MLCNTHFVLYCELLSSVHACTTYSTKWVKYEGQEYRKPCILVVGVEDDHPVFARLEDIYTDIHFKVIMQSIVCYSSHFHAYVVISTSPKQFKSVNIRDLYSPHPLHPRTVNSLTSANQCAVVLKHALCSL